MSDPTITTRFDVLETESSDTEILMRARDRVLGREVILKLPGPRLASLFRNREAREQVLREARALSRVRCDGVVRLLDVIETADGPVLMMDLVAGETLGDRLRREHRLAPVEVLALARSLATALDAVHSAGLVHRALSMSNVVMRAGAGPCIMGFGFARPSFGDSPSMFATSLVLDPKSLERRHVSASLLPPHLAPEQIRGAVGDARSDLFALGWLLYECATGAEPYLGNDPALWKDALDPTSIAPELPKELARAIVVCLAPNPQKRFESAAALIAALDAPFANAAPSPTRTSVASPRRRIARFAAAGACVLVLGALAFRYLNSSTTSIGASVDAESKRGLSATTVRNADELRPLYSHSYVLAIGIGDAYAQTGYPVLPNAESDAHAIVDRLLSMKAENWQPSFLIGKAATHTALLDTLAQLAERTEPDDRVFIYYAGHGEAHERSTISGWVVPADAKPKSDDPGRSSLIAFDEFFHFFDRARAKHVLIAMDCCYGGRLVVQRSADAEPFRERFLQSRAHVVISSGRPSERVSDGVAGEHSPFAKCFLDALNQHGPLTSTMLQASIQREFAELEVPHTPVLAHPETDAGEFVFFVP